MSELIKRIEAAEKLAADRADQIEVFKASVESGKVELAKVVELASVANSKIADMTKELSEANGKSEVLRVENESLKAKLALTPSGDLGNGDKVSVKSGSPAPDEPVDHDKVYNSLPVKEREAYRNAHRKELRLK